MFHMREIIFDTETTGLDPATGDRMVEIGCIEMVNRMVTSRNFHAYFNPLRQMPIEAERVHGLSDTFLADKPQFAEKAGDLLEFLADSPLVAHNAQFDFGFLNAELSACGFAPIGLNRMIDTLAIARRRHPGAKHTLDALCSRYGVDRSHRVLHGALLDAELLAQVYVELTGGRQIGLELAGSGSSEAMQAEENIVGITGFIPVTGKFREPRPHYASEEELARHRSFVESLKSPIWLQ